MTRIQAQQDAQIVRASLPLLTLALVDAHESYGYELVERLSSLGVPASTGLVYPVLTRLERDGLVTTHLEPSPDGPPRKYFAITEAGRKARDRAHQQWVTVSTAIAKMQPPKEPRND